MVLWRLAFIILFFCGKINIAVSVDLQCKWSRWFDVDAPEGEGDYETLLKIKRKYPEVLCEDPISAEGREVGSNTIFSNGDSFSQRVDLSSRIGLICKNMGQFCMNYEVRFCCPRVPDCIGGEWTRYINADTPDGDGDFETLCNARLIDPSICKNPIAADARLARNCLHWSVLGKGKISTNGFECKNNDLIFPFNSIADDSAPDSVAPTTSRLSDILPNEVDNNSLLSFPIIHPCDDYEVRFCCPTVAPPQCGPLYWTSWLNSDSPFDGRDEETLQRLWQKYPDKICKEPTAIDVRSVASGERYVPAENIEVNPTKGFKCIERFGETCVDYEVRFCCPKDDNNVPECRGKWTPYFDSDDPSRAGDFETLPTLREIYPKMICSSPLAADARAIGTSSHHPIPGQITTLSKEEGFQCKNSRQNFGKCLDYEIRFCCPELLG